MKKKRTDKPFKNINTSLSITKNFNFSLIFIFFPSILESYVCYVLLLIPSPSPKIPTTLNFLVGTTSTPPKVENRIIYTAPKGDDRQKNQKTYTITIFIL